LASPPLLASPPNFKKLTEFDGAFPTRNNAWMTGFGFSIAQILSADAGVSIRKH